jgi:hypothetical protein
VREIARYGSMATRSQNRSGWMVRFTVTCVTPTGSPPVRDASVGRSRPGRAEISLAGTGDGRIEGDRPARRPSHQDEAIPPRRSRQRHRRPGQRCWKPGRDADRARRADSILNPTPGEFTREMHTDRLDQTESP